MSEKMILHQYGSVFFREDGSTATLQSRTVYPGDRAPYAQLTDEMGVPVEIIMISHEDAVAMGFVAGATVAPPPTIAEPSMLLERVVGDPNYTATSHPHVDAHQATILRREIVDILTKHSPVTVAGLKEYLTNRGQTPTEYVFNFILPALISERVVYRAVGSDAHAFLALH